VFRVILCPLGVWGMYLVVDAGSAPTFRMDKWGWMDGSTADPTTKNNRELNSTQTTLTCKPQGLDPELYPLTLNPKP
jgi:hypothetical protein